MSSQSKIYVGNLSYDTTDDDLNQLFSQYGSIAEVKLITDRDTGRSKGFAFISFDEDKAAQDALSQNGAEFQGRNLKVNVAKERERRTGGAGGGGGRSGGAGGGRRW